MGVLLFIGGWVLVGATVFFVAVRGGPRAARETWQSQSRGARRATTVVLTAVYVGIGVAVPALVIADDAEGPAEGPGGRELTAAQERGRDLFNRTCGQCHTLHGANSVGKTGPNLDELRPPAKLTLNAIQLGRARGNGRMPSDLLVGRDARDVAAFVAAVAGR